LAAKKCVLLSPEIPAAGPTGDALILKRSEGRELNMRKRVRVIAAFAGVGFSVAWIIVLFGATVNRLGGDSARFSILYILLCPSSIAALGLDRASLLEGLLGWLLISLTNAILYSVAGAAVSVLIYPPWK
jgi:hypothetical protein